MNFPVDMYKIVEEDFITNIVCEDCRKRGCISLFCKSCKGKGFHKQPIKVWKVNPNPISIVKIDRDLDTGELQYWVNSKVFYRDSLRLFHFTLLDAKEECDYRNKNIQSMINNKG